MTALAALVGTYRLQLRPEFDFDDAAAVVPYLASLGVSHVYCSPYFATTPGSEHGYDVVDHGRVRDDLGGAAAHERFLAALREHGRGQIIDIVPHHMSIAGTSNARWWDVLTFGRRSRYADWFDIDWSPPQPSLRSLVLLPVLGDHYGRVLEDGALSVDVQADGSFVARYHELTLPLDPVSVAGLLAGAAVAVGHAPLALLAHDLVMAGEHESPDERSTAVRRALQLITALRAVEPALERAVGRYLDELNADPDRLDEVFQQQHYRLARWTVGVYELNYRRFFDVDSLIALRSERDDVFQATHGLVLDWARSGAIDGVRVDHVDGLRDPAEYLERLREGVGRELLVIVEKIVSEDEELPAWPVDGTTGYEMADLFTGVLVDARGGARLRERYVSFTDGPRSYHEVSIAKRRVVLATSLSSDVERLTTLFVAVCEAHRRFRDFARAELRDALVEVLVHVPVYRTYVRVGTDGPQRDATDLHVIDLMVARAREARPDLDPELFDLLRALLSLELDGVTEREFSLRCQQLTGPVVAKGDEDSAHYSWTPLLARNEVGSDPGRVSVSVDELHARLAVRQARWPRALSCTSTHDTKRSEDVRARLAVLSEVPDEFASAARRWWDLSGPHRRDHGPDRHTAWFIFQTLVGAHPLPFERAAPYVLKAIREAKDHTSWLAPDAAFESAVERFLRGVLDDARIAGEIAELADRVALAGEVNALSQTTLRLLAPGVPDTYQGTELWTDSLVDPDNRRAVDYRRRSELLRLVRHLDPAEVWAKHRELGLAKLLLIHRCLLLRRARPEAFDHRGTYEPWPVGGDRSQHAVAFARGASVVVVVPRLPLSLGSEAAAVTLTLPPGSWSDVVTGRPARPGPTTLATLTQLFPVAVLERT